MEKSQYKLCLEVLRRFDKAGILSHFILIGSWCAMLYENYFDAQKYPILLRTRDIDFLIPTPSRIKQKVDISRLLKDLGFIVCFRGQQGYIKLEHPELIIEFLVPEKGKGTGKPYKLPKLGLNAQALRFLNFLTQRKIEVEIENIKISLPHPAYFSLHKLIIAQRRRGLEKKDKDILTALTVLNALVDKKETESIKQAFNSMPRKWRSMVLKSLEAVEEPKFIKLLEK